MYIYIERAQLILWEQEQKLVNNHSKVYVIKIQCFYRIYLI
jgi:hypothetical protein